MQQQASQGAPAARAAAPVRAADMARIALLSLGAGLVHLEAAGPT